VFSCQEAIKLRHSKTPKETRPCSLDPCAGGLICGSRTTVRRRDKPVLHTKNMWDLFRGQSRFQKTSEVPLPADVGRAWPVAAMEVPEVDV
jgi:hypothetical protein